MSSYAACSASAASAALISIGIVPNKSLPSTCLMLKPAFGEDVRRRGLLAEVALFVSPLLSSASTTAFCCPLIFTPDIVLVIEVPLLGSPAVGRPGRLVSSVLTALLVELDSFGRRTGVVLPLISVAKPSFWRRDDDLDFANLAAITCSGRAILSMN